MTRRRGPTEWTLLLIIIALQLGCGGKTSATMTELQQIKSGGLDIVLLSPRDALHHGQDTFTIEFRSNGNLVDAGNVRATANMPMPGMPMFGNIQVHRNDTPGRYTATSEFEMAGTWRMALEWEGPAGKGSVTFSGTVR
jgi:hypothetical protein